MEKESELLTNLVNENKPKMLTGLDQNGRWTGYGVRLSPYTAVAKPGKRQLLTSRCGQHTELGKPDVSPGRSFQETRSKEGAMGQRVEEGGGSECRSTPDITL